MYTLIFFCYVWFPVSFCRKMDGESLPRSWWSVYREQVLYVSVLEKIVNFFFLIVSLRVSFILLAGTEVNRWRVFFFFTKNACSESLFVFNGFRGREIFRYRDAANFSPREGVAQSKRIIKRVYINASVKIYSKFLEGLVTRKTRFMQKPTTSWSKCMCIAS